jgi:hypothetical protein
VKTLALLWALFAGSPREASIAAASLIGRPDLAEFLVVVADLEGRGGSPGLHPDDARLGPVMHAAAMARGQLSAWCPPHRDPAAGWSPRQAWGAAPAYTTRHFGWLGCLVPAGAHDLQPVAAVAAALHAAHCGRVRGRSHRELRLCWAGGHKDPDAVMARFERALLRSRRGDRRPEDRS